MEKRIGQERPVCEVGMRSSRAFRFRNLWKWSNSRIRGESTSSGKRY